MQPPQRPPSLSETARRRLELAAVTALVAGHVALALAAVARMGVTIDEPLGMSSGYALLARGEIKVGMEQPPLAKALAAVPLLWLHPGFDASMESYQKGLQWRFARAFLFESGVDVPLLLFASRCFVLPLSVLLALALHHYARKSHGPEGALLALAFYCFDPAFLGHGPIVKNDVGAALFLFLALQQLHDAWAEPTAARFALAGLWTGLGIGTKTSVLAVVPMGALLFLLERAWRKPRLLRLAAMWPPMLLCGLAIPYGIVLLPRFFHGILWLRARLAQNPSRSYLCGQWSDHGFWYYWIVDMALKTPLPTLLALALALVALARRHSRDRRAVAAVLMAGSFVAMMSTSPLDLGVRHVLPAYPFLFLLIGGLAGGGASRGARAAGWLLALVLGARALAIFPDYLGFTNALAGARPERYIADSNLDWGQDLPRLAQYLEEHPATHVRLAFGGVDWPSVWGIHADMAPCQPEPGFYAASINGVLGLLPPWNPHCYEWLSAYEPVGRIGTSMLLYRIDCVAPPGPPAPVAPGGARP